MTRVRISFFGSLVLLGLSLGNNFVCEKGWHEETQKSFRLCRKSDGSNNWMCPLGWTKVQENPRCVPGKSVHAHSEVKPAISAARNKHAFPKALEMREKMAKCGLIRWSYGCKGAAYDAWWNEENFDSLLHSEQAVRAAIHSNALKTDILFLGNSHLSQLAEATMCALLDHVQQFWATDMTTGCLSHFGSASTRIECFGNATCGMYLARAKLKSGGRLLLANNHPWLFQGKGGLSAALRHLLHCTVDDATSDSLPKVDLSTIRTIVLGRWNEATWAERIFRPTEADRLQRLNNGKPPGSPPGDGLCGNLKHAKPLQAWDTTDVLHFLHQEGFRGNIVLAGMQVPPYELTVDKAAKDALPNMHFTSLTKLRYTECHWSKFFHLNESRVSHAIHSFLRVHFQASELLRT